MALPTFRTEYQGYCEHCGDWTHDSLEPSIECETCGRWILADNIEKTEVEEEACGFGYEPYDER